MTSDITKQERLLRDIADGIAYRISAKDVDFLEATRRRFGFEQKNGWTLMCHALDLIGDSELGIESFRAKRFDGFGIGEQLLRLHGLLTCCYQQGWAVLQLTELFKVDGKARIRKDFFALEVVEMRHVVSAHTVTFQSDALRRVTSYTVSRPHLGMGHVVTFDESNSQREWGLEEAVVCYTEWAGKQLYRVCHKAVEHVFRTSSKELVQYRNRLEELK